ncbi:MAG: septal ring lytic transglycosylase RlpA family protein, partial [Methyloceanibacter sp.]|uniref:septal ring lytic transglycosylase RlpA family protein n=1 Tax=Methyloceanibacter sp. TaxID=1965321 RepID=UPI003EDE814D
MGRLSFALGAGGLQSFFDSRHPARLVLGALLIASLTFAISACGRDESVGLGKRIIPFGQPVPKGGGRYQVGQPYEIAGVRYTPREDPTYDAVGQASWYGELFHGRYTANGEIYDMDRLSAAHPTLPLPIYVQVTNLQNGRSLVVRVNDRGPFKHDRIIDLSRRSAEVLGFRSNGTAQVRVKYLRRAPLSGDDSYERQYLVSRGYQRYASTPQAVPPELDPIAVASLPIVHTPPPLPDRPDRSFATAALPAPAPAPKPQPETVVTMATLRPELQASPEETGSIVPPRHPEPNFLAPPDGPAIQAGSFKDRENAERARTVLSDIAPVDVAPVDVGGETYYRVRVGPFVDDIAAAVALPQVTEA